MDMGTGCLRWLLALIPMGLLTALGLGFWGEEFEPQPLPPTPFMGTPTSAFDYGYPYYTADASIAFTVLPGWSTAEVSPGVVLITNAADPNQVFYADTLQSGEFQMTIQSPRALENFGAETTMGVYGLIDFFQRMQSPDAVYTQPVSMVIGGRQAARIDIMNASISREISFYALEVRPPYSMAISTMTLPGEGYLVQELAIQLMERILYLGKGVQIGTPIYLPDANGTPYATSTLIPYTPYGFAPEEYQMTIEAMYGTIAAQSNQLNTLMPPPTIPPSPTQTGAFAVQIADVEGVGDYENEAIVLEINAPVDLTGWTLQSNTPLNNYFDLPPETLNAGDAIRLYTKSGETVPRSAYYWGFDEATWEAGYTIYVYDSVGRLMDSYVIPAE